TDFPFNDRPRSPLSPLSLHDALPISPFTAGRANASACGMGVDAWATLSSGVHAKNRANTQPRNVQPSERLSNRIAPAFFLLLIQATNAGKTYSRASTATTATPAAPW